MVEVVDISVAERRRKEDDSILNEWKSDISTYATPSKKGPRTTEYDKQKGRFKCSLFYILFSLYTYFWLSVSCLMERPPRIFSLCFLLFFLAFICIFLSCSSLR